jgi:hypothetical protein
LGFLSQFSVDIDRFASYRILQRSKQYDVVQYNEDKTVSISVDAAPAPEKKNDAALPPASDSFVKRKVSPDFQPSVF